MALPTVMLSLSFQGKLNFGALGRAKILYISIAADHHLKQGKKDYYIQPESCQGKTYNLLKNTDYPSFHLKTSFQDHTYLPYAETVNLVLRHFCEFSLETLNGLIGIKSNIPI
jgi:hypothetical protein